MKTYTPALWISLIAAPVLALGMSTATPTVQLGASNSSGAGTYFFESVTQSTGQAINGFLTLHKGGTLTWADQSDFGAAGFFNSTTHGVWKKTGPDEVTVDGYYYRIDATGTPIVLVRITLVGSLVSGQGSGTVDVFGPNQNPVTQPPLIPNADALTVTSFLLD